MCLCPRMLAFKWKERAFIEKVSSRCVCWFPVATFICGPKLYKMWRLPTKLYNGAWHVSAKNSETVDLIDLRLGQIVYISWVFKNISFSWLLPLDGFQFIFLCCVYSVTVKTVYIKPSETLLGSLETFKSLGAPVKSTKIPTPWCPCQLYSDRFII